MLFDLLYEKKTYATYPTSTINGKMFSSFKLFTVLPTPDGADEPPVEEPERVFPVPEKLEDPPAPECFATREVN